MLTNVFLKLLNMSISAGYLVLAVILLRCLIRSMPRWVCCLLWGIVAVRLLVPVFYESSLSLIPSTEVIPQDYSASETPAIQSGIASVNAAVNPVLTQKSITQGFQWQQLLSPAAHLWLTGLILMLLYALLSYLRLRHRLRTSVAHGNGIWQCDLIEFPFVLGIFRPKIYLPSGMDSRQKEYVLAHEQAHIQRKDHWWKPLSYLFLSVYWFSPFVWLGYIGLCRDIERACDEKVIAPLDAKGRKGYSQALLSTSIHRRTVMICPVAFGESNTKGRIHAVLTYRKASWWIMIVSAVGCFAAALCFLSDPVPCAHAYESEITLEATCSCNGVLTKTCMRCSHTVSVSTEPIAHNYDGGVVIRASTCTQGGDLLLTCVDCGEQTHEALPLTEHIAGDPRGVEPANCTYTGKETATCTQCGQLLITQILPINSEHVWEETVVIPASCTQTGEGILTCTLCAHTENCTYEKQAHQLIREYIAAPTCQRGELYEVSCEICSYWYMDEKGEPTPHEWYEASQYWLSCRFCGDIRGKPNNTGFDFSKPASTQSEFLVIQWDYRVTP